MQLGAVLVFDAGPLELRHGGIDVERLRAYTAKRMAELPGAREASFELECHVRHVSLPRPCDERALKRLAASVFSQALDPARPPWELWVVEGLEGRRFALLAKLDSALLEPSPSLLRRALSAAQPFELLGRVTGALAGSASHSAHRRIEWLALAEADVAAVRTRFGGTERDVVLAALAAAFRRSAPRESLRVATPSFADGRVSSARFRLPVEVADARARLVAVRAACERHPPGGVEHPSLARELAVLARTAHADVAAYALESRPAPESLLGARLQAFVPIAPVLPGQTLGVTVTRLGDKVQIGLAADAARLPDLSALCDALAAGFDELRRYAAEQSEKGAKVPARRRRRPERPMEQTR